MTEGDHVGHVHGHLPGHARGAPAEHGAQEPFDLHEHLQDAPIMRLLGLAGQSVGNRFRRAFAEEDGLSPGAAAVLLTLAYGKGRAIEAGQPGRATHSQLAQRCMITPATLTGIVSTLEKAGYVRRDRDQADRRVVWLVLTAEGAVRARQIGARIGAANNELLKHLTPELEAAMRGFLLTVIEHDLAVMERVPDWSDADSAEPAVSEDSEEQPDFGRPQRRC